MAHQANPFTPRRGLPGGVGAAPNVRAKSSQLLDFAKYCPLGPKAGRGAWGQRPGVARARGPGSRAPGPRARVPSGAWGILGFKNVWF